MAKQLVSLKNDVVAKAGLCLWFSQEMLSVPHLFTTAHEAYLATKLRHYDQDFPEGVAVPVWFSWWGQLPGDTQKYEYDHAAVRAPDGKIWSSPLSGTGRAWFSSVNDLTRAFGGGMKYVGWSEDISNIKVIEIGEDMISDSDNEYARWEKLGLQVRGRHLTRDEFRASAVGGTWLQAIEILSDNEEADRALADQSLGQIASKDNWQGQIGDLVKQLQSKLQAAPLDTSDAEKKLKAIKDALGIK